MSAVFSSPTPRGLAASRPRGLAWQRLESLFTALGARLVEGRGSRVRFELNEVVASFHRPHPHKEAMPYQVRDAKEFLKQAGVKP